MKGAVLRYRVLAYITGVLIIVVIFAGIPLQVWAHNDVIANQVATVHGFLYILYVIVAFMLASKLRMRPKPMVVLLLAGTIPVMTFVVERWMTRAYIGPAVERALFRRRAAGGAPPWPGPRGAARRVPGA